MEFNSYQSRNHNRQKLDDDGCVDIRSDAHRKDGKLTQGTAREQIQQAEQVAAAEELLNHGGIHARNRNVGPHPENGEHNQGERDFLPKLRDSIDVREG